MRIGEIAAREDFFGVLASTLQEGWSAWAGHSVDIGYTRSEGGQSWLVHPLLSVVLRADAHREVRGFAVEEFRNTTVPWRRAPQWVLGTLLGRRIAVRAVARKRLWVRPGLPQARSLLVIPGGRTIRQLDFANGISRVFAKHGFSRDGIARETKVRTKPGPFLRITAHDPAFGWYEEPLVRGRTLPRVTDPVARRRYERAALEQLGGWLTTHAESIDRRAYLDLVCGRISDRVAQLEGTTPGLDVAALRELVPRLRERGSGSGTIEVSQTHGDFQAGNVLVDVRRDKPFIIDWEYSGLRTRDFDLFVYDVGARSPEGLASRLRRLLEIGPGPAVGDLRRAWGYTRPTARDLAVHLLEELDRALEEAASGPFHTTPAGLRMLVQELGSLAASGWPPLRPQS